MKASFPLFFLLLLGACGQDEAVPQQPAARQAIAEIYTLNNDSGTPIRLGEARLLAEDELVTLTITLSGMAPGGQHAVHLHEGSCENPGAHWNGGGSERYCDIPSQGEAWGRPYLGDIGNLLIDEQGNGSLSLQTELWALGDGSPRDLAGTFLMLHAEGEDFSMSCDMMPGEHQPSNTKIACGEIVLTE